MSAIGTRRVPATVDSAKVDFAQVDSAQVEHAQVDSAQVDHAQGGGAQGGRVPVTLWRLLATDDDRVALGLRLVLALVMFPHGAQHLFGWFGGYGYAGTHGWMVDTVGIPAPIATFAIVFEVLAPLALLVGAFGRVAAFGLAGFMVVAASTHHAHGFFMNWLGNQQGEGFEYHLLAIALALAIAVRGSGALSVDSWLARTRSVA